MILALAAMMLAASPQFEVATLKRAHPEGDTIQMNLGSARNGKVVLGNVTLADCAKLAWGLLSDEQLLGPDWIRSKAILYDIAGQTAPSASREQMLLMLQSLLEERLKLTLHHETRELRYLALVQAKTGAKMRRADETTTVERTSGLMGHISGKQVLMSGLAMLLSRFEHETVLDETGLDGFYEVNLEWTPESGSATVADNDAGSGASLFTAIQQQLGLRLESRKGPVDVIVVDHADQIPAEN